VDECIKRLSDVHVVILRVAPGAAGGADGTAEDPGEAIDQQVEQLQRLPQMMVGFVERPASRGETCLVAACDAVYAAPAASFTVVERRGGSAVVSLPVLRALGGRLDPECLASLGASSIDAPAALDLGLVSEVLEAPALAARREDLVAQLQASPAEAVAAQRTALRRRCAVAPAAAAPRGAEPPRCTKRPAASSPLELLTCKRLKGEGELSQSERCGVVASVLANSVGEASLAHDLLHRLVAESLGTPREQRQPFQQRVAGLIRDAMVGIEEGLQGELASQSAEIDVAAAERVSREAAEARAESDAAALWAKAEEARRQLADSTALLREALEDLKMARQAQETGDAGYNRAAAEKEKLEDAEEKEFIPLKVGSVTGARAKKQAASLVALAKTSQFDTSLLEGLQGALTAKPAQRTTLDEMVITAFETQVTTRVAELETTMAQLSPAREARAAEIQAKNEAHLEARRRHAEKQEALKKATVEAKEAEVALVGHRRAVESMAPELQDVRARRGLVKDVLEDFLAGPAAALRELDPGPPTTGAPPRPPVLLRVARAESPAEPPEVAAEVAAEVASVDDRAGDGVEASRSLAAVPQEESPTGAAPREEGATRAEVDEEAGGEMGVDDGGGGDAEPAGPPEAEAQVLRIMGMVEDMEDAEAEEVGLTSQRHREATRPGAVGPPQEYSCEVCKKSSDEVSLLLCDGKAGLCNAAYHFYCIGLEGVPEGDWFCPSCSADLRAEL